MSNFPQLLRRARAAVGTLSRASLRSKCVFVRVSSTSRDATSCRCYTRASGPEPVRIGCASGFWGDTATSVPQLVHGGQLDFLVFDYLSEITMSLLTAARTRTPNLGYAPDFVHFALAPFINDIHRKGIRVVSNAGGVNPLGCAEAIREVIKKAGLDLKVAVVTGDDLMPHRSSLSEVKMVDGVSRQPLPEALHSMNAYIGALPICRCLDLGADIVVTGRCVDSAVSLGPLMHRFGWERTDYDLLASGSLAGHLIECGAQSTGGVFTDWHKVPDWDNVGFPVVEVSADGSFLLTKPPGTGGLVSVGTAAEQLVYEISDPRRYLLPDVTCDFSQVVIQEVPGVDGGAVRLTGAKGSAPSHDYKVCATYMDGFRVTAVCPVGGPRAVEKARRTADSIIKRTKRMLKQLKLEDFSSVNVQILGAEDTYGPNARNTGSREAVIWMAAHHKQKKALEVFSREIAPAGTGMAPGLTGIVGGRPRVSPVLKPFFFLHPKSQLKVNTHTLTHSHTHTQTLTHITHTHTHSLAASHSRLKTGILPSGPHSYRLEELAFTRSGDKGDSANIGVIARHPLFFPYLKKHLTSSVVEAYFSHLIEPGTSNAVTRYTLPGVHGLNFVLQSSLGGGGVASLRSDPQGKAYGQMLLDVKLEGLPDLKSLVD
uniref:Si:ch73-132f6.5 n=1 Tax=Cyclopterus lumpus TaxID=8103 RepID=A0A8C2ZY64_CYCLU